MSPKETVIPDENGALATDQFGEFVDRFAAYHNMLAIMKADLEKDKTLFRNEAERRIASAEAPGVTAIEFKGSSSSVVVSKPDLEKVGNRTKLNAKRLQAAVKLGKFVVNEGDVEETATLKVVGDAAMTLAKMEQAPEGFIVVGTLANWLIKAFAQQNQALPAEAIPLKKDDVTIKTEQRLSPAAASRLAEVRAKGEQLDKKEYDALMALLDDAVKKAPVSVR